MSGGGGGGVPFGQVVDSRRDCTNIFERTILSSPVPEVLASLSVDDVLNLELRGDRGPLVAVAPDGRHAGSVTSASLADLIRCINEGHAYIALVLSLDRGRCEVEIRPRP